MQLYFCSESGRVTMQVQHIITDYDKYILYSCNVHVISIMLSPPLEVKNALLIVMMITKATAVKTVYQVAIIKYPILSGPQRTCRMK